MIGGLAGAVRWHLADAFSSPDAAGLTSARLFERNSAMGKLTLEEFCELEAKCEAGAASPQELAAMEPYRAKRAVLLASGFGSRMLPITINTPKPLVRVKGKRIIESLLDALLDIDVSEIYIVTGYLSEQFELLKRDYPIVKLIENPLFDVTNNISSAVAAKEHFQNAYVFESDLLLSNPKLLKKYQYCSNYLGVPVEETADWCFSSKDGLITDLHKGGKSCHHMYGISYWTADDGLKLAGDLPAVFERDEYRQRFWDDVPCIICRENYKVAIRECSFSDIQEIDSFAELQEVDPAYRI